MIVISLDSIPLSLLRRDGGSGAIAAIAKDLNGDIGDYHGSALMSGK